MSNKKFERKAERLRAARADEKHSAITTPRLVHHEMHYWGVGQLRLQLVRHPAFDRSVCYEVRDREGSLALFRSQSVEPGERWVIGYDEVEAEIGSLTTLLRSVDTLSIPILLRPQSQAALDGEVFEFAVHGGFGCAVRFSWTRGEVPEGWKRMVELVEAAIRSFDVLDIVAKP